MLNSGKKNAAPLLIIAAGGLVILFLFVWFPYDGTGSKRAIDGDGRGYFEYTKQILIEHNFGNSKENGPHVNSISGHYVIKYGCGTALLQLPFSASAIAVSAVKNKKAELSLSEMQVFTSIGALFYLLLGMAFLITLLKNMNITGIAPLFTPLLLFFGTNLMAYTLIMPSMSHVYSFFAISAFLYSAQAYINKRSKKMLVLSAIFLGLIYLIRPFNLIIIFLLPFFFGNFREVILFIKQHILHIIGILPVFITVCFIQNLLWYYQCGQFFIWPYTGEGFYFLHPEWKGVLFSFRKGLFVYTPLLLLILISGLMVLSRQKVYKLLTALAFFILLTYLISSWWCWTYYDGFGMRPFVDFYAFFGILAGISLMQAGKKLRILFTIVALIALSLNLFQSFQYYRGIIHPEYMNRESYCRVFLKSGGQYKNIVGGSQDLVPYDKFRKQLIVSDTLHDNESFNRNVEFGKNYTISNNPVLYHSLNTYADIEIELKHLNYYSGDSLLFVIHLSYPNISDPGYYHAFRLAYIPGGSTGLLSKNHYTVNLPKIHHPEYHLAFYIWNRSLQEFEAGKSIISVYKTF